MFSTAAYLYTIVCTHYNWLLVDPPGAARREFELALRTWREYVPPVPVQRRILRESNHPQPLSVRRQMGPTGTEWLTKGCFHLSHIFILWRTILFIIFSSCIFPLINFTSWNIGESPGARSLFGSF
jgi:hypothetical protein